MERSEVKKYALRVTGPRGGGQPRWLYNNSDRVDELSKAKLFRYRSNAESKIRQLTRFGRYETFEVVEVTETRKVNRE